MYKIHRYKRYAMQHTQSVCTWQIYFPASVSWTPRMMRNQESLKKNFHQNKINLEKNKMKMKKYRFKMKCNANCLGSMLLKHFLHSLLLMFVGSFWGLPVFICWRYAIIVGDYVMHWVFFGFDNTFKWHTVLRSPVIICWRYAIIMSDHVRKHGDYSLLRM